MALTTRASLRVLLGFGLLVGAAAAPVSAAQTQATPEAPAGPSAVAPRELDDRLVGVWVLDFQLTEQLSHRRLGIGDAGIQLRFRPQPELSPDDLELPDELTAVQELPRDDEVRSAGRLAFGDLGEGVYFVTGPDEALVLHYVRETQDGDLGAPWSFRLTLQPEEPPRQDLLILGGGDRFDDPPLVYARRSRSLP